MIGFLRGKLEAIYDERIVIDVNGMGFNVSMPVRELELLEPMGSDVKVYTYLAVREDAMQLYGFITADSLELFKLLIQVNGIGPKGALALLSAMSVEDLRFAIMSGDVGTISKAPGIGAKTAQRLIIDLKDKVSVRDMLNTYSVNNMSAVPSEMNSARAEAIEALTALGYSSTDALRAVRESGADEAADTETIIKLAFKQLAR
ncbi:MAG TPA: Holliday junction branch migration protein RuvA [Lachnospiraceae bacterium]|nr:Holliday junction branch migration protein RuvA [Lachnospiraceae bacterium]